MESKPAYPTQPGGYPTPYAPTTAQIPTHPGGYVPPGAAPQVEPPRELWFTVCKYYLLIVNGIACGILALLVVIIAIMGLVGLFGGYVGAFFGMLILAALVALLPLYYYYVPIQGAIQGLPVRLIVHGVLCGFGVLSALGSLAAGSTHVSTGNPNMDQFLASYTSTSSVLTRLIFDIIEVVACFAMANLFQKERRMNQGVAYSA